MVRPVPVGVGSMTMTRLLYDTVPSAKVAHGDEGLSEETVRRVSRVTPRETENHGIGDAL